MIKKWGVALGSIFLCIWMLCSAVPAEAGIRPGSSIAVIPIGFRGTDNTDTRQLLAEKASEFIGECMFKQSKFAIKTLEESQAALDAQGIDTEGDINGDDIEKIGKLLQVDYVVYGNISSFSHHSESTGVIVVETDSQVVDASIVLKIADTHTGTIVSAGRGKGSSRTTSGSVVVPLPLFGVGSSSVPAYSWDSYELTGETVDTAIFRASVDSVQKLLEPIHMLKKMK